MANVTWLIASIYCKTVQYKGGHINSQTIAKYRRRQTIGLTHAGNLTINELSSACYTYCLLTLTSLAGI